MVNSELSAFDEPVSNTTVVESAMEAAAPKRGPGMAAEANDHIEAVPQYTMLRRAFSAEATAMGAVMGLEASYPDIGSASFGSFVPKTVHEGDDRRQIEQAVPAGGAPHFGKHQHPANGPGIGHVIPRLRPE